LLSLGAVVVRLFFEITMDIPISVCAMRLDTLRWLWTRLKAPLTDQGRARIAIRGFSQRRLTRLSVMRHPSKL